MSDQPPVSPADSEAVLVQRAAAGDGRAYELLVIKYQRRIERLIGRFVRDVDLVPDIAQETFIRAWRALPQFRGEAQFYTWLYRIAINTARNWQAANSRRPAGSSIVETDDNETFDQIDNLTDISTPESLMASRQVVDTVNAAIDALPEDLRTAIVLREIEGLSYEDIAQTMNCPIGTVRSRIFRAREAIAAQLRPVLEAGTEHNRW